MGKGVVMIGFTKRLKWQTQETIADPEGYILLVYGAIMGTQWVIVGVYAPQTRKTTFLMV